MSSLFQKYGGAEFWSDFLNVFYIRITNSAVLSYYFVDKNVDHIKGMLIGLLEITLVKDGHYPEDIISDSHKHLGITNDELSEWIRIYTKTLNECGVEEDDQKHIIGIIEGYRPYVVTRL